jgi:hypothetical protein
LKAEDIKERLKILTLEASALDPNLAKRLEEVNRWIKNLKPGSLTAKKFVTAFLLQLITDSTAWLKIQVLSEEEKELEYNNMTPTESYWYGFLFPKWISTTDPKFSIWKQKLMAGEFNQDDGDVLRKISESIIIRGGSFWQCYIADLSMATDLIISNRTKKPLCIQVTSVSEEFNQEKYDNWVSSLIIWEIQRGLFLHYNPAEAKFINQLVNLAMYNSDNLRNESYLKFP